MHLFANARAARLCFALLLAGIASPALAAPFCIENQALPPQCNYYDAAQCETEAARQGGVCSANPQQMPLQAGVGQYCVAISGGASSCVYSDRGTCMAAARQLGGACTAAPAVAPSRAPDPYAAVNGQ